MLLLVTMVASFTPTPLYPRYREEWGVAPGGISVAFAGYPVGVIVVLLLFGGVSDRWGRAPTLRVGALLLLTAMGTLALAPGIEVLTLGRVLQGVGTGLITSAGAASLMELHPAGPTAGSHRNALMLSLGIAIGPVLAALGAMRLPQPLSAPYVVVALLVLVPFSLFPASRVQSAVVPGRRLVQPVLVPRAIVWSFTLAAAAIAGTNATFALLGSFGPDLMAAVGRPSQIAAGLFVTSVLLVITALQLLGRRLPVRTAMTAGLALMAGGWSVIAVGTESGSLTLVLLGGLPIGLGAGLGLLASASHVGAIAPAHRRAETYAAYLMVAFLALASAALLSGRVVETRPVWDAAAAVGLVNLVLAAYLGLVGRHVQESV